MYFLRSTLPNLLKTLFDKFILVKADANLSPLLGGKNLILELNIFAT